MPQDLRKLLKNQCSNPLIMEGFWILYLVRYATFKQLKSVRKLSVQRVFTKKNLAKLTELGYLKVNGNVYSLASKGFEFLGQNEPRLRGEGSDHTLKITDILLSLMDQPHFFTVEYPHFGELVPDACIIWKDGNRYKVEFLEVENSEKHPSYLEEKRAKYERNGKQIHQWWGGGEFCYSVRCYGDKRNWRAWRFF